MVTFIGIYTEKERIALINKEIRRLGKSKKDLDESRKVTLDNLFSEAAFMVVALSEVRQIMQRDGTIEEYQNGANQSGIKKSAAFEVYDKMLNTYMKVVDQINKALPETAQIDASAEILKFASGAK